MAKKRIIELTTETTLKDGQYVAIDHATDGTKKYDFGGALTDLKEDISDIQADLQTKAEIDGAYDNMTVGNAEQLVSTVFVEDSTPYKFRTTGGSVDVGDREYVDAIIGGTVAWNQLVTLPTSGSISAGGASFTYNADGETITINGTTTATGYLQLQLVPKTTNGHVYFVRINRSDATKKINLYNDSGGVNTFSGANNYAEQVIGKATAENPWYLRVPSGESFTGTESVKPNIFDLTQAFGTQIADYIYSLEQANAGAGVAFFRKLFPKDYYEYNEGELISVSGLQSHDMVGFNQFDGELETAAINLTTFVFTPSSNGRWASKNYIPVISNATYYITHSANNVVAGYTDDSGNGGRSLTVNSSTHLFTIPDDVHFIKFGINETAMPTDICINLSWDGERDGEYEPYIKHSYALDDSLTLRGIPKLDASNQLYYDGDRYLPSGEVERRYGIVDLGSLDWGYNQTYSCWNTSGLASLVKKHSTQSEMINNCAENYVVDPVGSLNGQNFTDEKYIFGTSGNLFLKNGSTTTPPTGLFVYELATPTTETAESYNRTQICDDFGTEEFISDSIVPVGHETKYANNLRAKLEMAPNSPDGDGDYIVRQTNGENTYVPLEKELPTAPSTDGSYVLKCTVSGGTATYTWESD